MATDGKFSSILTTGNPLDVFFRPSNVAVIGATEAEGSVGRTTLWNLISSPFGGAVFPVNPKRASVLGIKAYSSIRETPADIDLAVVVTPAPTVPGVIAECSAKGVKAAIVISAGFKELGPEGAELERQVMEQARVGGMRIIGPNCLGLMSPPTGLNATFARGMARAGAVGFISQSGALCTAVLDWSFREHVGFSAFVSLGSMVDVNWGDLITYLGDDPRTRAILIYMESIGDAQSFLSAAREVALAKPILLIKAGRTAAGGRAAASHTGAMTGSFEVLEAAFRRCGVLQVSSISELFYMAEVLAKQPRPRGPKLTIVTNAGGPAVLATDTLIAAGGELSELAPETHEALGKILPPHWSRGNPIDILGDAGPQRYAQALEAAAKDPNTDGLLVILTPQAMTDPTRTAEQLKSYAKLPGKPVLASWMGGSEVAAGQEILAGADIPVFPYPDTAARMFRYMYLYSSNLNALYETPVFTGGAEPDRARAGNIIRSAGDRTLLTEIEAKRLLAAYGIPVVEARLAADAGEAVRIAGELGYPVVLKLHSETITHKTDVGGVALDLRDPDSVRAAFERISKLGGVSIQKMVRYADSYELILGSSVDPQFGPVILFGMGGQLVEVFQDRALSLPPLTTTLARRMMERTKIYAALKGVRGRRPVDLAALEQLLVRFSQLVSIEGRIAEIDINPLVASPDGVVALDARVVLHDPKLRDLPRPAIRPYPHQYVSRWKTKNSLEVTIRPIRPEDEPLLVKFHEGLGERTVYLRYLQSLRLSQRVAHERLVRICFNDYAREIALVAVKEDTEVLAVGRLQRLHGKNEAEIALLVSDQYQRHGLGTELVRRLIQIARDEGIAVVRADILSDNSAMQRIVSRAGFKLKREIGDPTLSAELAIDGASS